MKWQQENSSICSYNVAHQNVVVMQKKLKDETDSVQAGILGIFPDLSVEATIFHTKLVCRYGTIYKNNNALNLMDWIQCLDMWKI